MNNNLSNGILNNRQTNGHYTAGMQYPYPGQGPYPQKYIYPQQHACLAQYQTPQQNATLQQYPGTPYEAAPGQIPSVNMPALPTGYPTGASLAPAPITATGATLAGAQIAPQTLESTMYTPGYLKTQIGRKVRVEFLIGTNSLTDRTGTLLGVGASYILLLQIETDDVILCDIYSIKFVTFYH